jgi:hypothetical protein
MRDFYAVERTLELLKQVEKRIRRASATEIEELLDLLESLTKGEPDPRVLRLVTEIKNLRKLLSNIIIPDEQERIARICIDIQDWERMLQDILTNPTNAALKDLPSSKNPQFFLAYVKELSPVTVRVKHQINEMQLKDAQQRKTEELMRYDPTDPIAGYRQFGENDNPAYPGSMIILTAGHHRVFELYKRFMKKEIDGNRLILIRKSI